MHEREHDVARALIARVEDAAEAAIRVHYGRFMEALGDNLEGFAADLGISDPDDRAGTDGDTDWTHVAAIVVSHLGLRR